MPNREESAEFHAEWMQRLDRLMPVPTLLVAALVVSRSEAPILSALCILLYAAFNIAISQIAMRGGPVSQSGPARLAASGGALILLGWLSGPDASAWYLGVLAVFAAVFAESGWRQIVFVLGFSVATLVGAKLGGETWTGLVPIAVYLLCVCWLSAGLSRALYAAWYRARCSAADLIEKNERLEVALSTKQRFLATMSHEIRTPLNGVLGMAEVLESTSMDTAQRAMLRTIQSSGKGLLVVLNDVLDTAKLDAGKLHLETVAFDPAELLGSVLGLMSASTQGSSVRLVLELDPSLPPALQGDPSRIRQVLLNLLGNALKFTPTGQVEIRGQWANGQLRIDVEDSGIGISSEAQQRVFEPFAQASQSHNSGGTGLGLSISKQLAELMNGSLSLSSTLGVGSCFSLIIPAPLGTLQATVEHQAAALSGHILLVDDNEVNLTVAQRMLTVQGCIPTLARNGAEALELAEQQGFDLVLMDCQMPVMDGLEATRALRARGVKTPILALTASVTESASSACIDAGMDAVLAKPVSMEMLNQALKQWLNTDEATLDPVYKRPSSQPTPEPGNASKRPM